MSLVSKFQEHPPQVPPTLHSCGICQVREKLWKDRIRCQRNGENAFPNGIRPCLALFLSKISSRPCWQNIKYPVLGTIKRLDSMWDSLSGAAFKVWNHHGPHILLLHVLDYVFIIWPHGKGTLFVLLTTKFPSIQNRVWHKFTFDKWMIVPGVLDRNLGLYIDTFQMSLFKLEAKVKEINWLCKFYFKNSLNIYPLHDSLSQ